MITLVKDTIDKSDIDRLIEWLKTYPRLTKGEVTLQLEEKFSKWLGRKYSVFVNSGSSANLLMLSALQQGDYLKNNKVVVPSTSWATDLAPVIQLGMEPLLCDSNLKDLSVDLLHLEEIFKEEFITYFEKYMSQPNPVISVKSALFSADSAKPRSSSYRVSNPKSKLPSQ